MLNKPSKDVIEALHALESDARFKRVLDWIGESKANLQKDLLREEGITLHKTIGKVTLLNDFEDHVAQSRKTLERYASHVGTTETG